MAKQAAQKNSPKSFRYELYPADERLIPSDENGVKRAPYPPLYTISNSGMGINPKTGEMEEWRYVYSFQKSIWRSEQPASIPAGQITDARNDLTFRKGMILVREFETAKIAALEIQEGFKDCKNSMYPERPKLYFKIDQEVANQEVLAHLDDAYEAEKRAREMPLDDLYAMASLYAIDLEQTDTSIRTNLILKSKQSPAAFLKYVVAPTTKIRFMFLQALQEDLISASKKAGKIVWTETDVTACDVPEGVDAADQLTKMWGAGDKNAIKIADQLKKLVTV